MVQWQILPGITHYSQGMALMEEYLENIITNPELERVIMLEHADVYSAGTSFELEERGSIDETDIVRVGRGGKITYHGPGQRVIYPILSLDADHRQKDLRKYIKDLENVAILTLADFGIKAFTKEGMIGIWVNTEIGDRKIGAIGVRIKKWKTFHGLAINISTDLTKFDKIIPCGIKDFGVTSMKELGKEVSFNQFDESFKKNFQKIFG